MDLNTTLRIEAGYEEGRTKLPEILFRRSGTNGASLGDENENRQKIEGFLEKWFFNRENKMPELLTHSRMSSFKGCRKAHYYSYERGLRRTIDAKALRMGSAFHAGVEVLGLGGDVQKACESAYLEYGECPEGYDHHEWNLESETVARLVSGYEWRWKAMPLEYIAVELPFRLPLINPETNGVSKTFELAGKIDAIVRLEDQREAVKETKLFGDDISVDSDLWPRMRMDQQVSLYLNAARRLGHNVETVLYDVARKPTIKPNSVPVLDINGAKIVLDKNGDRVKTERGIFRTTGDTEKGYVLQTRPMTVQEWGDKLTDDIVARPDYYFARVEIPRMEADLKEFDQEAWEVGKSIRDAQLKDAHYRTVSKMTCPFCAYFNLCSSGAELGSVAPLGFSFVSDRNPELQTEKRETNVNSNIANDSPISAPITTASATDSAAAEVSG